MANRSSARTSGVASSAELALRLQVEELLRERDAWLAERDEILKSHFGRWLDAIRIEADAYDYQRTLSWRITQPIRYVEAFFVRARHDGFGPAFSAVGAWLRGNRSSRV